MSKKEIKIEAEVEIESDSNILKESNEVFSDIFSIESNNVIDSDNVISIEMPQMLFEFINGKTIFQKTTLKLVILDGYKTSSKILDCIKNNNLIMFNIKTFEDEEKNKQINTWIFENPKIKMINFGNLISMPGPEKRIITCEIQYDNFNIIDKE